MAAAFRSAWGLGDRSRRPAPSIAQARQTFCPQKLRVPATSDVLVLPGGMLASKKEATCSLDAVVEAEIRTSSRPGSQAPNAQPALTFGLPGKQKVNQGRVGCDLIRLLNSLAQNRRNLRKVNGRDRPRPVILGLHRGRVPCREQIFAICACVFSPDRSDLAENRRTRFAAP